jgi:hypothetical protein
MASVSSITRQISALDISSKKPTTTSSSKPPPTKQPSQANVAKLLTKFAAPNPFTNTSIDIGHYDGGLELDNEKRGERVYGQAAEELALNSSLLR